MDLSKLAMVLHFEDFAAWVANFCSRVCQINQALDDVVSGRAWWQKEK